MPTGITPQELDYIKNMETLNQECFTGCTIIKLPKIYFEYKKHTPRYVKIYNIIKNHL